MKRRIDQLMVERGLTASRTRAQALLMAGVVFVGGQRVDKAGTKVDPTADIVIHGNVNPFVSRGGLKLAGALDEFGVDPSGRTCLDVGASTGGFTDCLLQRGALRVYAVDVGYGQLAWKLRNDPRVIAIERSNIRRLPEGTIPEPIELAVADCSFISLRKVLPPMLAFLAPAAELVVLVKPQFEVGRGKVGKGGVVRNEEDRLLAITGIREAGTDMGLEVLGGVDSQVHGPKGNIEHLLWLRVVT